jgi:hypothetical protein
VSWGEYPLGQGSPSSQDLQSASSILHRAVAVVFIIAGCCYIFIIHGSGMSYSDPARCRNSEDFISIIDSFVCSGKKKGNNLARSRRSAGSSILHSIKLFIERRECIVAQWLQECFFVQYLRCGRIGPKVKFTLNHYLLMRDWSRKI